MSMTRQQKMNRDLAGLIMVTLENSGDFVKVTDICYHVTKRYSRMIGRTLRKTSAKSFHNGIKEVIEKMIVRGYLLKRGNSIKPTELGLESLKKWRAVEAITNKYMHSHWIAVSEILDWFGFTESLEGDKISEYEILESIKLFQKDNQELLLTQSLELLVRYGVLVKDENDMYRATDIADEIMKFL